MCYTSTLDTFLVSTNPIFMKKDLPMKDSINTLSFNLNGSAIDNDIRKKININRPLFPKVTEIELNFDEHCPVFFLQSISI